MKIYVVGIQAVDRLNDVKLVRAFSTEKARDEWRAKVDGWLAEICGADFKTPANYRLYEVELV